jgi:hypothetical protein
MFAFAQFGNKQAQLSRQLAMKHCYIDRRQLNESFAPHIYQHLSIVECWLLLIKAPQFCCSFGWLQLLLLPPCQGQPRLQRSTLLATTRLATPRKRT